MKRLSLACVVVAAGLLFTGCGSSKVLNDAEFIDALHKSNPAIASVDDAKVLTLVHSVCKALRGGSSKNEILEVMSTADISMQVKENAGFIIGFGVPNYCADQKNKM